jgi:eukaryotic-like serine/threonine-protein kinase
MLHELQRGDPRSIGPYQLVGQLGSGGMGRVFLARSLGGRLVAVKVIRSDLAADPDFRVRFRREVAAARRVSGVYTATVVDADADAEEPWLATAYVAGPSLTEAVYDHGPLPARSVLALAAGLAESLAAIHKAGVVHRDLKPSNVLLAEDGPRLIDFGISRAAESTSVTRAGFVIGSPGFMSPEQAQGSDVGPPSDMFSLGAVLVFAATGEPPFGSGSTAALVFRVVFAAPQLDAVPDAIRRLVERCLAKDPSQRPTASELLTEIGAMQPVTGWLPDPVTSAFPGSLAQVIAPPTPTPPPPPAAGPKGGVTPEVEVGEPSAAPPKTSPTVTGFAPFIATEPEVVAPAAKIVTPDAGAAPPEAGAAPPEAGAAPPEAGAAPPEAGAVPPEPATVPPKAGTAPPEPATVPPEAWTVPPEPATRPARLGPAAPEPGPGPEAPTSPDRLRGPEPEPEADLLPLPWADGAGPRRSRPRRPVVLGAVAAAVILIAGGGTALALTGSGHPSAAPTARPTIASSAPLAVITPPTQSATTQPSPTSAPTSHRASPSSSRHPTTQPAVVHTTAAPAPSPVTHSSTPTPKPSTPKPTHAPTPTTFGFSVSGASELSCGVIGSVQSNVAGGVNFPFVNNSRGTVVVDEIGADGKLYGDATLSPGGQWSGAAYVGLYYVVEKSGGGCLAVFKVTGSGGVTVT